MRSQQKIIELRQTIRWIAQTIHQAYHQDQPGTFFECPKSACREAAYSLDQTADEELPVKRITDWYSK